MKDLDQVMWELFVYILLDADSHLIIINILATLFLIFFY